MRARTLQHPHIWDTVGPALLPKFGAAHPTVSHSTSSPIFATIFPDPVLSARNVAVPPKVERSLLSPLESFAPFHPRCASHVRGVKQLPDLSTNHDNSCFHRPKTVQPISVPLASRQAMVSGHALEVMRVGTSPLWASGSPTTLIVYAHLHTGLACFIGIALHRLLPCAL
jgi:hypothetical protein